ncbi:reverse transcriptase [Quillaja saponaria]|uniref:Reverse transcriptase n=1 Tax=Quillaja saponaria TaxID=32244 RepID=A0AAD7PM86_QUISA|nr:reverse transcriptase [Quillaja saponaria]
MTSQPLTENKQRKPSNRDSVVGSMETDSGTAMEQEVEEQEDDVSDSDDNAAKTDKLVIWVRFPGIPIECHESQFLMRMAERIGSPIKCDTTTSRADRGNFARICVEVDLSKPLVSRYELQKQVSFIEYEGHHLVCFQCRHYGHAKETCPNRAQEKPTEAKTTEANILMEDVDPRWVKRMTRGVEETLYGEWMIVRKGRRLTRVESTGVGIPHDREGNKGNSSRRMSRDEVVRKSMNESNQSKLYSLGIAIWYYRSRFRRRI